MAPANRKAKPADERLKAEQGFISAVLDTVGALIVVLDREGRIVLFNETCARVTGYSFEEVRGKFVWDVFLIPEEVEPVRGVFEALRAGMFPNEHVNYWVTRAGDRRRIAWSNTALLGADGTVEYVIGTGIDETERARLEEHFREAERMEAVGRLAGGVAHDFGSILTAVTGYAVRAMRHLEDEHPLRADLKGIIAASERAADLVRRLLLFSRREAVEPTVLDLNVVVTELDAILRRVIGDKVELIRQLNAKHGRIKADRSQVEQVILNLVINARDAMPDGGKVVIEISEVDLDEDYARRHVGVAPGRFVLLTVSDTGQGMTAETLSRAFEPFFSTKEQGTGLGLATVYSVVKEIGHLTVDSRVGHGTTFNIYLPRIDGTAGEGVRAISAKKSPRGSETILVVEDDDGVRAVAVETLREYGYRVLVAQGSAEALRVADELDGPIHLVLIDMILPAMTGKKLADLLTARRPELAVLYMSGYPSPPLQEQGLLAPHVPFLAKPFTPATLARKVRQVLDVGGGE